MYSSFVSITRYRLDDGLSGGVVDELCWIRLLVLAKRFVCGGGKTKNAGKQSHRSKIQVVMEVTLEDFEVGRRLISIDIMISIL